VIVAEPRDPRTGCGSIRYHDGGSPRGVGG